MLAAACLDSSDTLAALSIGERDRRLLTLRQLTFGSQLASVANCSRCGETLEWTIETTDLLMQSTAEQPADLAVDVDDYHVRFRLPAAVDLALVASGNWTDADSARQCLLENCVLGAEQKGEEVPASALPLSVTAAIVKRMAEADPQADLKVELSCPACGEEWQAQFDIESFFWSELCSWAQRMLSEVHRLARAYGWSETEILGLSPWRRQVYLSMAST